MRARLTAGAPHRDGRQMAVLISLGGGLMRAGAGQVCPVWPPGPALTGPRIRQAARGVEQSPRGRPDHHSVDGRGAVLGMHGCCQAGPESIPRDSRTAGAGAGPAEGNQVDRIITTRQ
jgi:hypothetical protein